MTTQVPESRTLATCATARPIQASDRVSDVLARDESLVDVFVRLAPHFAKLRNRMMRRVMARLVTVEQAAQTAGIPVAELLRELNGALGLGDAALDAPDSDTRRRSTAAAPASEALAHPPNASVVELDVRDDLRSGREPFSRIMTAVGSLRDGEVLELRTTFEPVPLLAVLAKRGFAHETGQHAPDDWAVWFWRPASAGADVTPVAPSPPDLADEMRADPRVVWLDVRGLEPPEPLLRTLAALETLPVGHELVQVNARVPQLLFPMLAERGFACDVDESRADRVLVRIWRR